MRLVGRPARPRKTPWELGCDIFEFDLASSANVAADEESHTVTVDGKEIRFEALGAEARQVVNGIVATDAQLLRLRVKVGVTQAARQSFTVMLRGALT